MAGLIEGAIIGDVVSKASSAIIEAIKKTRRFKPQLTEMKESVDRMRPLAEHLDKLNKQLDRPKEETEMFMKLLNQATDLAQKCEKISMLKKASYSSKLDSMNASLKNYLQSDFLLQIGRDMKEALVVLNDLKRRPGEGSSIGWRSSVPLLKDDVIGFGDRVTKLKAMLLEDSPDNNCSVVVVSALGGSGKTTLVTLLRRDPEIQRRFEGNIYPVTVSERYDIKVIVTKLLNISQPNFTTNEEAIELWRSFLSANDKYEILLVLDDVWSESVITDLMFKSPKYKILVTSRMTFKRFKTYPLLALNDQDATTLFRGSAFPKHGNDHNDIPDDLVYKLVKCCKNHPLTLSVIGGSLNGEHVANWEFMLNQLSEQKVSVLDLHETVQVCLEKSLHFFEKEPEMKQCYLDLGLFPEDQKIAATTLMDIWSHRPNHDKDGLRAFNILSRLSSRNFATLLPRRKHLTVIANYCEEEYVLQHDMMRALGIQLSCRDPIEHRERLIIDTDRQDLLQLPQVVNARIMSISTGVTKDERLYSTWKDIKFPNVEVLIVNFMSDMHPLPEFMQNLLELKVLIITNYGYYFSEIQNFPASQYLSGLTRIRLDHVSISSISSTILELKNLQKLSLIMCKIGDSFNEGMPNKLSSLVEIDIESCDDFVTFPAMLCNLTSPKILSITNCHELTSLSEQFGKLSSLEVLRLASCSKLPTLPESIRNLKNLRIIDLSHCLNLHKLPQHIGELGSLQTINVVGCTGLALHELPESIKDLNSLTVICDEEASHVWSDFKNVKRKVVEEDALETFNKIIPRGHNM